MTKILVVDDQLGIRLLLNEAFREDAYEVFLAANGKEALRLLGEHQIELVLMDMKMPGMNGIDVLHEIRFAGNSVKVIMMTAYEDEEIMKQLIGLQVTYLRKPFDLAVMRAKVQTVLK